MSANLRLKRALPVDLLLDGSLLSDEGHLVRVGAQLAASALVQVTLDGAWIRVRGKVHVVAHLNCVLADVHGLLLVVANHLAHEVLMSHLQVLLLRLLVLVALEGCKEAHLHVLRDTFMALASEACRRAFLIVNFLSGLLRIILNLHRLILSEVIGATGCCSTHQR